MVKMPKCKCGLVLGAVVSVLALSAWYLVASWATPNSPLGTPSTPPPATTKPTHKLFINDVGFTVSVAADKAAHMQGLSGTASLAPRTGMLFVFDASGYHGMWMKEMNYALDMIWINDQLAIVHIAKEVTPNTYATRQVFRSPQPARFVLEIPAGSVDTFNIQVGQPVTIPPAVLPSDLQTP